MIYLLNFWRCIGKTHNFKFDSDGLTGDWIRCTRCGQLDEYIPGTHEPKGYAPTNTGEDDEQS